MYYVKCIYYVCIGGGHCGVCWGTCCPLVNTVLNTLVQAGELSDDAEVSVCVLSKCIYLCYYRIFVRRW